MIKVPPHFSRTRHALAISAMSLAVSGLSANVLYFENFSTTTGWNYNQPADITANPQTSSGWLARRDAASNQFGGVITNHNWDLSFETNPNSNGINNNQVPGETRGIFRWAPTGTVSGVAMWTTEFSVPFADVAGFSFDSYAKSIPNTMHVMAKVDGNWYVTTQSLSTTLDAWANHSVGVDSFYALNFDDSEMVASMNTDIANSDVVHPTGTLQGFGVWIGGGYLGENMGEVSIDNFTVVPEPSTYVAILGLGSLLFVLHRRRR